MKIALIGYGKMGKAIEEIALKRHHEIVLKITSANLHELSRLHEADVAIEFTRPASAIMNLETCFNVKLPVVTGTTGWYDELPKVKELCSSSGGGLFYASNFSVGVNIFFEVNKRLAALMNSQPEYDVFMEEVHHTRKLDSPSGTAITLAGQIIERLDRKSTWKEGSRSSMPEDTLAIESKRIDEVPGTHIITYHSETDHIELKHEAHNRSGFAFGAVLAAEYMKGKRGIFNMEDLLKFE